VSEGDRVVPGVAAGVTAISVAGRVVRFRGPSTLLARVMGPLASLEMDVTPAATDLTPIDIEFEALAPADVPPIDGPRTTRWMADPVMPRVIADGVGIASLPRSGSMQVGVRTDLPAGDDGAERLTIPALAERMRRDAIYLIHAAVLLAPDRSGAWLVPAARGGGKTTLSLSLRRAGWFLLSDDRGWLFRDVGTSSDNARLLVDPWPEAPRVGDRSLFLLPPHAAAGPRDPRTTKASVPSLTPPRLTTPVPISGVFLPRLVDGPGGTVRALRSAAALLAVVPQCVIATDPTTASDTLRFIASLLAHRPCFEVCVGDDPAAMAAAVARVALAALA
jgi:hypothetical protein